MILSKKWLNAMNPQFKILNSENMTEALNCLGQELEGVKHHYQVNDLCVGYVESFRPHPNADHLNVVTIKTNKDTRTIVCGAPNMFEHKYVCVANVGSTMVNGLTLVAKPLRGVDSHGMICAFHELTNLHNECLSSHEKENVIFLDDDANLKTNIYSYLGLDDEMYDVFVQANRNDLNGAYYLGKSLASYFDFDYPELKAKLPKISHSQVIADCDDVYGFGLLQLNSQSQLLPWKQKSLLINCGIKTYDDISDYASYLAYLFAIPYLAIDVSKVQLPLTITKAKASQVQTWTVHDKNIEIRENDLIVVDASQTIVSYGNLIVNPNLVPTQAENILLLTFNANVAITRNMVQANKINNQNSLLAVKPNTNAMIINSQQFVFDEKLAPTNFFNHVQLLATSPMNHGNSVKVSVDEVNQFLGTNLTFNQYSSILTKYGFVVHKKEVIAPPVRSDSYNVQDIAEDVLVRFNLNQIQPQPIDFQIQQASDNIYAIMQQISDYLVNNSFYNAKTYNLTSTENADLFNWYHLPILNLKNPSSNLKASFNTNKIDSLLNVLAFNQRAKNHYANWFEITKLYPSKQDSFNTLTIVISSNWFVDKLSNSQIQNCLLNATSIVNNIFKIAHKKPLSKNDLIFNQPLMGCYPENSIEIKIDKHTIGYIGQITHYHLKPYKLKTNIFAISINLDALFALPDKSAFVQPISSFNDIVRSVNVVADFDVDLLKVVSEIQAIENIVKVQIVDKYLDHETISYIIEYTINNLTHALDSKELDVVQNQVMKVLDDNQLKLKM